MTDIRRMLDDLLNGQPCYEAIVEAFEAEKNRRLEWERRFNDDSQRCKVRNDYKNGRFIAPVDCGKADLEARAAEFERQLKHYQQTR